MDTTFASMKITAIKQQVKNPDRYSIFVDGKFMFGLSELALMNAGLAVGRELDKAELEKYKAQAEADKAYNRVLALIARRARSEWEVRDYLKRKKYDPEMTDQIIARLYDRNFLNDVQFATMWVENRRLLKSTSKRRLQQELRAKRIRDDIIDEVLGNDETDEREVLRELVARKQKQTKYQDKMKLMQYLSRQGYNYGDIKDVLDESG